MKSFFIAGFGFAAGVLLMAFVDEYTVVRNLTAASNSDDEPNKAVGTQDVWRDSRNMRGWEKASAARMTSIPPESETTMTTTTSLVTDDTAAADDQAALQSSSSTTTTISTQNSFEKIVQTAYAKATAPKSGRRKKRNFNITWWEEESGRTTTGGLTTEDRILLAEIYGNAESVFEFGLGESTYLANYLQVPRYAGTDSDPTWVANTRMNVAKRFRFYFSDIGSTKEWGKPQDKGLKKNILNYQLGPLIVEGAPFDVYMVDGRYRLPSALASFLHASSRGGDPAKTIVLIHDCYPGGTKRQNYFSANHLLNLTMHSGNALCVFQRFPNATDAQLEELWHTQMNKSLR